MSEVRPWIGSVVSVALFRTIRDMTVVDCSVLQGKDLEPSGDKTPEAIEQTVWANIDHAFSRPVTRSDNTAEYAATQILAEVFRQQGIEGVVYKSAFSAKRYNIAFFDLACAEQILSSLFQVEVRGSHSRR
jgi:hypothetical protein